MAPETAEQTAAFIHRFALGEPLVVKIRRMSPARMAETRQHGPILEGSFRQILSTSGLSRS
jgi:hypothetical protein